jgi:hypothetical protein
MTVAAGFSTFNMAADLAGDLSTMIVALTKGEYMKKRVYACITLTILALGVSVFLLPSNTITNAQSKQSGNPKINSRTVLFFGTTNVVPNAGTTLFRDLGGLFFTFHTQGLPVGHAVSAWMAIFNNPEYCATSPCSPADFANPDVDGLLVNTGARVIGVDGAATYGAYRAVGDITGRDRGSMNGLVDPLRAEIHLVLRDHGVASTDAAVLQQQLSMFNGGCPGGIGCANLQVSVNQR